MTIHIPVWLLWVIGVPIGLIVVGFLVLGIGAFFALQGSGWMK